MIVNDIFDAMKKCIHSTLRHVQGTTQGKFLSNA